MPAGYWTIWTTVALDLVGFGIVVPILGRYAERFGANGLQVGLMFASFSVAQMVFAPILGRISDKVGRKPVIVFSLIGTAVGSFVTGAAGALWVLFLGRILDGASGASVAVAQGAVADIAPPEQRARLMGMLGAAFGVGFVVGPALGGLAALNTSTSTSTATNNNINQNNSVNTNIQQGELTNKNINQTEITQRVIQPPPTAVAPAMLSGGNADLCSTGSSGSVQTQVFGVSSGGTVRDMNCERLKLSKTLYDMGMKVAAVATMCQDRRVFDAMLAAGTPCPYEGKIGEQAKASWEANPHKIPKLDEVKLDDTYKKVGIGAVLGVLVHKLF
jgi:hypothetical protein